VRHNVQHVEVLMNEVITSLESGHSIVFVDCDQVVLEFLLDPLAYALVVQGCVVGVARGEHDGRSTEILDLSLLSNTILAEGCLAQVKYLLRCTTAFNWERWASEHSGSSSEPFSEH